VTADRATAYTDLLRLLESLGDAKLHADEQAAIRDAADALLFSPGPAPDDEALLALDRAEDLVAVLVEAERLIPETGEALLDGLEACGPQPVAA
jgi:hypothetical protein